MDWPQFISSIVSSLVWPGFLAWLLWMLKDELKKLLPALHVKHKDWEASFRLGEAAKEAKKLPRIEPEDQTPPPTPEEVGRFEQLLEISPTAAIVEMHAELEEAIARLWNASFRGSVKLGTINGAVRILRKNGAIDSHTSAIIHDLRTVGNTAAHTSGIELTKDDAIRYRELLNTLKARFGVLEAMAWEYGLSGEKLP
jgi:hypothetical protein